MSRRIGRLRTHVTCVVVVMGALVSSGPGRADVTMPSIFGSHMVLQQGQANRVWGWADPGEQVALRIADQQRTATADATGRWQVVLAPMPAGDSLTMVVAGNNQWILHNVAVGEVWLCAGQSNMQWDVERCKDADLEKLAARFPNIRFVSVPQVGTQVPQDDFEGEWQVCSPDTVSTFSAVGYFFGRQLHKSIHVPVGLIDVAWGGSACEAWVRRDLLALEDRYRPLLQKWNEMEQQHPEFQKAMEVHQSEVEAWQKEVAKARLSGQKIPRRPGSPDNDLADNARPGNIYNGVLKPVLGYGIRGAIWYQGESNVDRAYQYRHLFPLMIQSWRTEWQQGDFPVYWAQLADYKPEKPEPADSDWAELREAQTLTMTKLPNVGEAVLIDLGEGDDIHPRNKQDVGKRLARWALARDYGLSMTYRSPIYQSLQKDGGKITVTFDHVGGGLTTEDTPDPRGFAIAGSDRRFVWAEAKIVGPNQVQVWSDQVMDPVAVRYAWADNPRCNVTNTEGLPVTPFRTDEWPGVTQGVDR